MRLYKGIPLKTCANDFLRILNHTGWGLEVFVRVLTLYPNPQGGRVQFSGLAGFLLCHPLVLSSALSLSCSFPPIPSICHFGANAAIGTYQKVPEIAPK